MRIIASATIILFASALSLPSAACDRHGGGMFGQFGGSSWTEYNPAGAEADSLTLEEQLSQWHKQNAATTAKVPSAKPSFSKVSSRASTSAKARLAIKAKLRAKEKAELTSTAAKPEMSSETAAR